MGNLFSSLLGGIGGFFSGGPVGAITGALGGMGGGSRSPASDAFGPGTTALVPDQAAAGPPRFSDQLAALATNALLGGPAARLAGLNQRRYNRSAYPGVPDYELTGTGSAGAAAGAVSSPELVQRERESRRSAQIALATSRMSASSSLAGQLIQSGGSLNAPLIGQLLRAGGLVPPGAVVDPGLMSYGKAQAEIANLNQEVRRSQELLPADLSKTILEGDVAQTSADRNRMEIGMAPWRYALDEWIARYGKSYSAQEISGLSALVDQTMKSFISDKSATAGPFAKRLFQSIQSVLPNGSAVELGQLVGGVLRSVQP